MEAARSARTARPPGRFLIAALILAAAIEATLILIYADLHIDAIVEGGGFLLAGLAIWHRRPENRIGKLLVLYPFLVWTIHLQKTDIPLLWTISGPLFFIAVFGIPIYTMLAYPRGRLSGHLERGILLLLAGMWVWNLAIGLFLEPSQFGCSPQFQPTSCPPGLNLFLLRPDPEAVFFMVQFNPWWLTAVMVPTAALLITRFVRATRPQRRVLGPVVLPALAWLLANRLSLLQVFFQDVRTIPQGPPPFVETLLNIEQAAIIVFPFSILFGLARSRLRHARVSRLVVELGDMATPRGLEEALTKALGDTSLRVGVWDEDVRGYVRENGEEVHPPGEGSGLVGTLLEREGRPLALMVHDEALLDEPGLVEATAAATRLTVENERLHEDIRAQLEEVKASRARIVEASDAERRRVERNLHDGAQQRLVALSMDLRMARSRAEASGDEELIGLLQESAEDLDRALADLRELGQGLHPATLTEEGLAGAIEELGDRSPVPLRVNVPRERYPEQVEATAYFVASESLANVAKYARASEVAVAISRTDGHLVVEVSDDGVGGAEPSRGSGLRGLADRVAALGGELRVSSPPGGGTQVTAEIPCESSWPTTRS